MELKTRVKDEWIRFEINVLRRRSIDNPALRAEAFEAFIGGAGAMFRIFCDEVSTTHSQPEQARIVQEIREELTARSLEAGRK